MDQCDQILVSVCQLHRIERMGYQASKEIDCNDYEFYVLFAYDKDHFYFYMALQYSNAKLDKSDLTHVRCSILLSYRGY